MSFTIKQNDTSPSLGASLKDADLLPVDITGATVKIHIKSLDNTVKVNQSMTIITAGSGVIQYDWQVGDTDTVGTYYVEFEVTYSNSAIETFPNNGNLVLSVVKALN